MKRQIDGHLTIQVVQLKRKEKKKKKERTKRKSAKREVYAKTQPFGSVAAKTFPRREKRKVLAPRGERRTAFRAPLMKMQTGIAFSPCLVFCSASSFLCLSFLFLFPLPLGVARRLAIDAAVSFFFCSFLILQDLLRSIRCFCTEYERSIVIYFLLKFWYRTRAVYGNIRLCMVRSFSCGMIGVFCSRASVFGSSLFDDEPVGEIEEGSPWPSGCISIVSYSPFRLLEPQPPAV